MNRSARPVSEEELHAFVDGRLEDGRRHSVERYLRANPDTAERVAIDIAQRDALRSALSGHATDPIPPRLNVSSLVEQRLLRRRAPWRVAAAVLLALALGGAGGWWVGSRPPSGINALAREAAINYAVYAVDQRRPVEITVAHRQEMAHWLSRRLNRPLFPPDLSSAGYQLLGGRLSASPHGAAALFVYQDAAGRRLIIYVRPMTTGHETTPIHPIDVNKLDGCAWIDQGVGYSLMAAETYPKLLELSRHVRQEVRTRD